MRLLADVRLVFGERDSMPTEGLLSELAKIEEAPWADLRGKPLDSRRLAALLRPYGVASRLIRVGERVFRGYARLDLHDPWVRYLPREPAAQVTAATGVTERGTEETL
jgi:hypothetical protein